MKKIIRNCIKITIIFLLNFMITSNAFAVLSSKSKEFLNEHSEVLKNMSENSNLIRKDNDLYEGYFNLLKYNNKIKITLCENILKYGDNKEISNLAKVLINKSMNSNSELNSISEKFNCDLNSEDRQNFYSQHDKYYDEMIIELNKLCGKDNINIIFLKSYYKINEFEIKVSNTLKDYTNDENYKKSMKKVIDDLKKENKEISNIYKNNK